MDFQKNDTSDPTIMLHQNPTGAAPWTSTGNGRRAEWRDGGGWRQTECGTETVILFGQSSTEKKQNNHC